MFEDKTLLIIEDDKEFAALLVDICRLDFKNVSCIHDAKHAISVIENKNPDIVLCDINMPKKDGIELSKVIKTWYKDIIVVLMTAYPKYYNEEYDFISKPFLIDNLYAKIKTTIN